MGGRLQFFLFRNVTNVNFRNSEKGGVATVALRRPAAFKISISFAPATSVYFREAGPWVGGLPEKLNGYKRLLYG